MRCLGVVATLHGLLLVQQALGGCAEIRIALRARLSQLPEMTPHPARVHLRDVEVGLFVSQRAETLRAVAHHRRLNPRFLCVERRDRPELERAAPALPGVVDAVCGLGRLIATLARNTMEVTPPQRPRC